MNIIQRPIWRRFIEKCVRSTYPKSIKLIELELPDQAWKEMRLVSRAFLA